MLLLLALACAPHPAPPEPPAAATPAPAVAAAPDAIVRPPVTLDQFRAAFPVGTTLRLRIEIAGKPPIEEQWTWVAADAETCTIASKTFAADGSVLAEETGPPTKWTELMSHADFPAAHTTQSDSTIDVPAGHFDTWLFTQTATTPDGKPEVKRYHFAKTLPGPPVLFTTEVAGVEVFRMTMLSRSSGP